MTDKNVRESLADFDELKQMLRTTISAANSAGIPVTMSLGAMMSIVGEFFLQAERRGLPPECYDDLIRITNNLVHRARG